MSKQKNFKIKHLHLSFADLCGGNCLYCPAIRATSNKGDRIMKDETFDKILSDVLRSDIKDSLETITISENGNCFLNKNFISYLRKILKKGIKWKI